jgi:hypothetical protein
MTERQIELLDNVYQWSLGAEGYPSEWGELMSMLNTTETEERWLDNKRHGQNLEMGIEP